MVHVPVLTGPSVCLSCFQALKFRVRRRSLKNRIYKTSIDKELTKYSCQIWIWSTYVGSSQRQTDASADGEMLTAPFTVALSFFFNSGCAVFLAVDIMF